MMDVSAIGECISTIGAPDMEVKYQLRYQRCGCIDGGIMVSASTTHGLFTGDGPMFLAGIQRFQAFSLPELTT